MNKKVGKHQIISIVLIVTVLAVSSVIAEKPKTLQMPSALELRKTGVVRVQKNADGNVDGIKLIVTSYNIVLDEGSKALEKMDGQKVKVMCTFKQEGEKKWLTVKNVEPVPGGEKKTPAVKKPAEVETPKKASEKPAEKPAEKASEKNAK